MKVNVLEVKVDDVKMGEALKVVSEWLEKGGKHYIVTPNPEMVMAAQKDKVFKKILNDADLSIPDGVGLKLSGKVKNAFSGINFMEKLISLAVEKGLTTGFLGGRDGVAKIVAECLLEKYPNLKISYVSSGGIIDKDGNSHNTKYVIPNTDLLFVAFGHIKQEKWIAKNLPNIPVKVAMGVGGSFDELSGKLPHIPTWVYNLGLKWLVRLMLQPWRVKRQLALLEYLWKIYVTVD